MAHSFELAKPLVKLGKKKRCAQWESDSDTEGPDVEAAQGREGPTWPNAHGRWSSRPCEAAQSRRNSAQPEINKKYSASAEVGTQDRLVKTIYKKESIGTQPK